MFTESFKTLPPPTHTHTRRQGELSQAGTRVGNDSRGRDGKELGLRVEWGEGISQEEAARGLPSLWW